MKKFWFKIVLNGIMWIFLIVTQIMIGLPTWVIVMFFILSWIVDVLRIYEEKLNEELEHLKANCLKGNRP